MTATAVAANAYHWTDSHPLPTGREEAWKYTPVTDIAARLAEADVAPEAEVPISVVDAEAGRHAAARLVLVNGVLVAGLSDLEALPPGVRITSRLTDPTIAHRTIPAWDPPDGFVALNRSTARDVLHLRIRPGVTLDQPIHVVHIAAPTGRRILSTPRVVVDAGAGSRGALVESYVGLPGASLTNASTIVGLDVDADLTLHRVQHEPTDGFHVGHLHVTQHPRSNLTLAALSLGGAVARLGIHVLLAGGGARADLGGLSAPVAGSRHDTVVTVDHAASECTSDQRFRSVVAARARSSFSGHVVVRPGTVATDARQRSDALLLSPDAQADSRPWLEIFADDVRCTHGSATGRLADDALFYLRSRGIPRDLARQMLVGAFARAVTEHIDPPSLREQVEGWMEEGER